MSDPVEDHTHINGGMIRKWLVSESSELMVWYAQMTGQPWLRGGYQSRGLKCGPFPCSPTFLDIEVTFEKAFSQWRRLVMRGGYQARQRAARRAQERAAVATEASSSTGPACASTSEEGSGADDEGE